MFGDDLDGWETSCLKFKKKKKKTCMHKSVVILLAQAVRERGRSKST